MSPLFKFQIGSLKPGEVQQFKNLAMVPIVSDYDDGLAYITLEEALSGGSIEIREVSEGGSVPELRVVNRAGKMVLILDGEEFVGAKQNRIVDTTILVAAGVEIVIQIIDTGYTLSSLIHLDDHDSLKSQTTGMPQFFRTTSLKPR